MNRLADASSPYLRQHADNPVDWYPWGDEAFERARVEDKPLFVSIGYASCHWCHVMAHESFEDSATAADLSRSFISVKVDREERPDVDAVYMTAVQTTTGSGGWPMSVFCTPDGRPFFAGTYFPPSDRHGMPSFRRVVGAVAEAWRDRRAEVEAQADSLVEAVARDASFADRLALSRIEPPSRPRWQVALREVTDELARRFDATWGGFGPAPKFPRPTLVDVCLRHHLLTGDAGSLAMATTTLDAMAAGGLYDHLEGGFARYSTDRRWLVPHFEKMLTDQALLVRSYLHAWQVTGSPAYLQVVTETVDYVREDLRAPSGGLCSSVDADAAGVEGGHATWTPADVVDALRAAGLEHLAPTVCEWYGVTEEGNWEGRTILHRPVGAQLARPDDIEVARRALLAARRARPQPARDDKVLTEWNAMFAAALAEAAAACARTSWARRAEEIGELLFERNRRADGRWLRVRGTGSGDVPAFAPDYAWLIECCTRLGELTGRASWTERAEGVAASLLDLFWDDAVGGLYTSGHDAERLIVRSKELLDGAVPSATSQGAQALLRLSALTGEDRWRRAGERLVELAAPLLEQQPLAVADVVPAVALLERGTEIVVTGERADLLDVVRRHWLPEAVVAWGEPTHSPLWAGKVPGAAHVCHHYVCRQPARDAVTLDEQLSTLTSSSPR
jgi:uncharacterized protein